MSSKKSKKILVVIPTFCEEKSLQYVIDDIRKNTPDLDILIINDGSRDRTTEIARKNRAALINHPYNLGIGASRQTGYMYAREKGYDYVAQFDGDGQHEAKYIMEMINTLEQEEVDLVLGSRFIDFSGYQSEIIRKAGISFIRNLISYLTGQRVTDPTSGFRVCNKRLIELFSDYHPADYPEPEMLFTIIKKGFKYCEVPVTMRKRIEGTSHFGVLTSIYYMLKVSLAILIDHYRLG